ncbi:MAG: branched-chain amino acid ABC transporter permease [Candidatus Izemoplasmataceae bacterium]|uniref:Branched-chain amino acid ABC transporter permease n=1 Tax=Firmicutes bacterium enrichment culture clone fosmid MGS-M2 TaxID=1549349 RepID=A0A0B5KBU1_9FIRM|nr:branched-chain amino acid ABC transporter permease [Firmicutes bacterium enrichment culture clone fosmid MGS-M2]
MNVKFLTKIEELLGPFSAKLRKHPNLTFVVFGLLLCLVALLPHLGLMNFGTMSIIAYITIYAVTALGLNILLGFSGLISLGTAGFVGAGALGTAVFIEMGLPFELAVVLVLTISGSIGALIGLFSLKVEGIYLAIATLFVGEILRQIYTQVPIFGGNSIQIDGGIKLLGFIELSQIFKEQRSMLFVLLVIIMVLMMIAMNNIIKSKTGRALLAMSRSEHAAQAMGISLLKYRLTAFVLATLFATVGGIMYAMYFQTIPTTSWSLDLSLFIIAMVVVGGFKSIYGTFLGAFIIHGIPNLILKDLLGDISYIFSGVLIILVIIFYPNGFVYIWVDIKKGYSKLKNRLQKDVTTDGK